MVGVSNGEDEALNADRLIDWVEGVKSAIGIPQNLGDIGISGLQLGRLAEEAYEVKRLVRNNGRPMDLEGLRSILLAASTGDRSLVREAAGPAESGVR